MRKDKGIQEISDHVYSFAKEFGFEKYVELSKSGEEYYTTNAFDEELSVRHLIERYDDDAFWGKSVGDWANAISIESILMTKLKVFRRREIYKIARMYYPLRN